MKIRSHLVISFVCITIFSVLGLSTSVIFIQNSEIYNSVTKIASLEEDAVNESIEDIIDEYAALINDIVSWIPRLNIPEKYDAGARRSLEDCMKNLVGDDERVTMFYFCGVVDVLDGGFVYNNIGWNPPSDFSFAGRNWYRNAMSSESFVLTDPYVDFQSGDIVVTFSRKVTDNGKVQGVVAADININEIIRIANEFRLEEKGSTFIIDGKGNYITNPDITKIGTANFFDENGFSQYKNDVASSKDLLEYKIGGKYFITRSLPEETGWIVVTYGATRNLFSPIFVTIRAITISEMIIVLIAVGFSLLITNSIVKPINKLKKSMDDISSGQADLTKRLPAKGNSEISEVERGFNRFSEKLQSIVSEIRDANTDLNQTGLTLKHSTAETTSAITQINSNIEGVHFQVNNQGSSVEETSIAINQIASNIKSLDHMIENQSSQVTEASAAIEQMISSIASVNQNVANMSNNFGQLLEDAASGSQKQGDVNERIRKIVEQSEMLQEANLVISNIAEQTNLLAMNAAIEAAHAGESGKGFSVVADEIRKLSETSTSQSKTIGQQLENIRESIEEVVEASAQSSTVFESMIGRVKNTSAMVSMIASAMEEQKEGSKQIGDALHMMTDSTYEVKNASAEMSSGATAILDEVKNLQDATFMIKDSMGEMAAGAKQINQTGSYLSNITSTMNEVICKISNQIDQFTV